MSSNYLESQLPMIMDDLRSILGYYEVLRPVVSGHVAFQVLGTWSEGLSSCPLDGCLISFWWGQSGPVFSPSQPPPTLRIEWPYEIRSMLRTMGPY